MDPKSGFRYGSAVVWKPTFWQRCRNMHLKRQPFKQMVLKILYLIYQQKIEARSLFLCCTKISTNFIKAHKAIAIPLTLLEEKEKQNICNISWYKDKRRISEKNHSHLVKGDSPLYVMNLFYYHWLLK